MTSQSAGAQRLRNPNSGFARPQSQYSSQQTPRSVQWQATVDPIVGTTREEAAGPSIKKQKLDGRTHIVGNNVLESGTSYVRRDIAPGSMEEKVSTNVLAKGTPSQSSGLLEERDQLEICIHQDPFFPRRPERSAYIYPMNIEASANLGFKEAVKIRSYVAEPPSSAPRIQEGLPADFFPWSGNHPEDILNEATIKQGYFDKMQGTQAESSTARPSVWSSLKHKSGLQILSSLFVSILDQRQAHGIITANSTFKPPPRVTLIDTKREAWLRDLANPSIPLRRLSRTIPHGIRGKVLLDHCLVKRIPIMRAIWLAKCVGANEIRAFKRKGASGAFAVGGETKWIKDWTINVEQFLEMILAQCGTPEWRSGVDYGLRLVTQFFSEHLLDQEHYIDWLLSSVRMSDLNNAPLWLLVIRIHWEEILEHRQRGRRLAEAMMDHLFTVNQQADKGIFASLENEMIEILRLLLVSAPACLLVPDHWIKHQRMLQDYFQQYDDNPISYFDLISKRNVRLAKNHQEQYGHRIQSPRQKLITLLDSAADWASLTKSTDDCLKAADDSDLLVITCLEWASSLYRSGHARIYLAARMLRRWSQRGYELQKPILTFLTNSASLVRVSKDNVYRLLAELVISRHFLVGKYLQWLMARGTLTRSGRPSRDGPCDVRLLFELPLHNLSTPILNLRTRLLASMGASVAEERITIISVKLWISINIPGIFTVQDAASGQEPQNWEKTQLSQTVKSSISRWVRQAITAYFGSPCIVNNVGRTECNFRKEPQIDVKSSDSITLDQYHQIQLVLERMDDFVIIADVLKILSDSTDDLILAAITDTINHHFDTLTAIGAVENLFQALWQQYQAIHSCIRVEKYFIESLIDLGRRLPKATQQVRFLEKRLVLYEQTILAAACSPISDHMAEALQSADSTFPDEIDQLMASGTSMDKPILSQVFQAITKRLELSWQEPTEPSVNFAQFLVRLRSFDPRTFDSLITEWLGNIISSTTRPSLGTILPPLICTHALTLDLVLTQAVALLQGTRNSGRLAEVAIDTLDLLTLTDLGYPPPIAYRLYRFRVQQQLIMTASASSILLLVHAALTAYVGEDSPSVKARYFIAGPAFRTLIQNLLLQDGRNLSEISSAFDTNSSIHQIQVAVDGIIYPSNPRRLSDLDFRSQISQILELMCDFNIPLCQLRLRIAFGAAVRSSENAANTIMTALLETAEMSSETRSFHYWPTLVSGLTTEQASRIREEAETELISDTYGANLDPAPKKRLTETLLSIIEATTFSINDKGTSSVVFQIADRMTALLTPPQLSANQPLTGELAADNPKNRLEISPDFIVIILRLLLFHQPTLQEPKISQIILERLLLALSLLLIHPIVSSHPSLPSYVFDTLALLTDFHSEETRSRCIHVLREQHRIKDPRLLFLFGYSESAKQEWLQLLCMPISSASDCKAIGATPGSAIKTTSTILQPFPLRRWEMMQDATPLVTENDTSLNLTLFGARKAVL